MMVMYLPYIRGKNKWLNYSGDSNIKTSRDIQNLVHVVSLEKDNNNSEFYSKSQGSKFSNLIIKIIMSSQLNYIIKC